MFYVNCFICKTKYMISYLSILQLNQSTIYNQSTNSNIIYFLFSLQMFFFFIYIRYIYWFQPCYIIILHYPIKVTVASIALRQVDKEAFHRI